MGPGFGPEPLSPSKKPDVGSSPSRSDRPLLLSRAAAAAAAAPAARAGASAAAGAAAGRPPAPPAAAPRGLPRRGRGRRPPEAPAAHQDLGGGPGHPAELHPGRRPVPGRGGHPDSVRPAGPAQVHHHQVLSEPAVLSQAPRQAEGQLGPRGGRGRVQRGGAAEGFGRERAGQERQQPLLGEAGGRAGGGGEHRPERRPERLRKAFLFRPAVPRGFPDTAGTHPDALSNLRCSGLASESSETCAHTRVEKG